MIGISHNSRGSFTHARSQTSRGRSVFLSLVIVLTIGSAGQTPRAQAAPASVDSVVFKLEVFPEKRPMICTGKPFALYAAIDKTVLKIINKKVWDLPAPSITDPNVSAKIIGGPGRILGSLDEGDTQTAFVFKSDKPGDTTIKFTANIRNSMVGADEEVLGLGSKTKREETITLKIRHCKVKVKTLGDWNIPGEAQGYAAAMSNDAEVKAPDAESPFTGSTTVNWVASVGRVRDCGGAATIGSSKLDWNGTMDESGQLNLNGDFQTAAGSFDIECAGGGESFSESMQVELTPDPVSVTVGSSGGVINQSQTLEWEGANPGQITIIVIPTEDTTVAFIPGIQDVSWDDFSSLFGALIPLP
jgi:hypothetical protein